MPAREPESVRFPRYVAPANENGCLLWLGGSNGRYGLFALSMIDGKQVKIGAHVWAWEQANGPVPEGMTINHICRVTKCVNVGHMELLTITDNNRYRAKAITHCPQNHPYSGSNVIYKKNAHGNYQRICRTCRNEANRRKREVVY